jgi:hypothetical protein
MNKDLYNSTVTFGKCQMRSSDQLHLNNITFDAEIVSQYARHIEGQMDEILFNQKDDSELMQLIQMHKVTLLSLIKMN